MKSVMISINPKWCELIASGEKTIEVRKTKPKCDVPFKCYIYCTNDRKIMLERSNYDKSIYLNGNIYYPYKMDCSLNGKVIGEFVCDKIGEAHWLGIECFGDKCVYKEWKDNEDYLTNNELLDYMNTKDVVYGWHISDLKIYDKPKELSEFSNGSSRLTFNPKSEDGFPPIWSGMTRPPQSWCYVEEVERENNARDFI